MSARTDLKWTWHCHPFHLGMSMLALSDDCLAYILSHLGPRHGAVFAISCQRLAPLFADPLLWRHFLIKEFALPVDVHLDGCARELYRARGAWPAVPPEPGARFLASAVRFTPFLRFPVCAQSRCRPSSAATRPVPAVSASMA